MKKYVASAERNREALLSVIRSIVPAPSTVLEIGAGTGQHAAYFASELPTITWIPSDSEEDEVESIAAYRREAALPNLKAPLRLDARRAEWDLPELEWPLRTIVAIDVVGKAPWPVCVGLFNGAGALLPTAGRLALFGTGGVWPRPLEEMTTVAKSRGLDLIDAPGENWLLFRRS